MESGVKTEVNGGGPLPQRQKNQGGNKNFNKPPLDGGPAEKKPRFNQGGGAGNAASNNQNNRGGFGNKGFGNNRNNNNRNRGGGGGGRGNFQNQQVS